MKIAYIILAHRYGQQLIRLVRRLDTPDTLFVIHLDQKMKPEEVQTIQAALAPLPNVAYIKRRPIYWGDWMMTQVMVDAIQLIVERKLPADYILSLSGQCYPLRPNHIIAQALSSYGGKTLITYGSLPRSDWPNDGMDRIEQWHFHVGDRLFVYPQPRTFHHPVLKPVLDRMWAGMIAALPLKRHFPKGFQPCGGQSWWCLSREAAEYVSRFVHEHPRFMRYFHYTFNADEIFLQTVLVNSPLRARLVNTNLHYVDWSKPVRPAVLGVGDLEAMLSEPDKMFARKFDTTVDARVLDLLDEHINQEAVAAPAAV